MKFKTLLWSIMTVLVFSVAAVGCSDDDDVKPAPTPDPDPSGKTPVLTLSGSTLEVAAEGGEASMAFTVENPVEGVTPKASCGSGWLQNINAELNGDKGRVVFTATKNEGEAREATVTLRYQGTESVNFTVKQVAAGTEPEPEPEPEPEQPGEGPKVEISATYDEGQKVLLVDMICTTKNADKALFAVVPASAIDESISLEEFMESPQSFAKTLSDEKLAALNGDGIKSEPAVAWEPDMDGVQVVAIILAKNASGKTAARADAQLGNGGAQPPIPGEGPQVTFKGYIGDYEVLFEAKSSTKNVASGEIIVMLKEEFDGILAGANNDFNAVADQMAGQGQALEAAWCEQINGDTGMEFYLQCADPTIILSAMLVVYDADHHRTVAYAVADKEKTPSESSDTGNIEIDFTGEASSNTYLLTVFCTTKNCTDGWLAWRFTDALNEMVAKGSLESAMDELKTMSNNSQKFEDFWVRNANNPHKGLKMSLEARPGEKMSFLVELSNRDGRKVARVDLVAEDPYQGKSEVKALDDKKFSDLVWDYNANPSKFTFKGNRPCVLDFGAPAWCGWCQELEPVMVQLSAEFKDQVDFYTIDTDYHKGAYQCFKSLFGTDGIPVLAVVDRNGNCKVVGGYLPADKLRLQIKIALNAKTSRTVTAMPVQDQPRNYVSLSSFNPVKNMMDRCLF